MLRLPTEANKLNRVSSAVSLLGRLNEESFLDRLMTGYDIVLEYFSFRLLQYDLNGKKELVSLETVENDLSFIFNEKPRSFYDRGICVLY